MKFCSVGAVKYRDERKACDVLQYLFDKKTTKPTDAKTFLSILPDARSISHENNGGTLKCSPLAGYADSKLYLTNVTISPFGTDVSSTASLVPASTVKLSLDAFYMFCCVYSKQAVNPTLITTGTRSVLENGITHFDVANVTSPLRYRIKTGGVGYRMVFYPNALTGKASNTQTYSDYNLSVAQPLTYSNTSSYVSFGITYYRSTQYTTYISQVRFSFADNVNITGHNVSTPATLPAGALHQQWSALSFAGIQFFRPTKYYYYYDTQYSASGYYQDTEYVGSTPVTTENTLLPYMAWADSSSETVELGFSAVAYRDLEKSNIVIRDFGTDLTQTGSTAPNTLPTVQLVNGLNYDPLVSILNI